MKEAEITTEELDSKSKLGIASVLPQKQLGIDTNKDCDEQLSLVWKSFEVLESKMEIVDSKLDSLTIESAVIPPDAASTTTPDTTHVTTPIVTTSNITKPASISRVRRQRRQRARIECVQDVFCAAENTHIQLTQYSMFLRKREMDRHVAAGAAEASSQAKEQCSLLRLMTAVGRVQFDASRLASSPALYLPSAAVSQSSPTRSASNASNNYRPFVHAYLDTSSNAIRNALQERQHNSMDQLAIILTEASILLWKNLG